MRSSILEETFDVIGTKTRRKQIQHRNQKPFDESGEAITSVQLKDQTVVTSGIYERYFKKNGKLYHHIWIHEPDIRARTIFTAYRSSDSSTKADALSTTCFLLGYEEKEWN